MNKNKRLKISVAILAVLLCLTSAYAYVVMTTKTVGVYFNLKATYGLELYKDPDCTIPMTTYEFSFNETWNPETQKGMLATNVYVKNTGNIGVKVSIRSDFQVYHSDMKAYFNNIFYLDFHTSAGTMLPEHDVNPTYIDLPKGSVIFIQIDSKCYTTDPLEQYTAVIFINGNKV
jgi:hypothetical protein